MNSSRSTFGRLALLFLALGLAGKAAALQISLTSDTNFLTDFSVSPTMQSDHVSVSITNTDGVT